MPRFYRSQLRAMVLVFSSLLASMVLGGPPATVKPQLHMEPAWIFDMECQTRTGFKIDPEWQKELFERQVEFQIAWDESAPNLIKAAEENVGRKFQRASYEVVLSLCNFVPMAKPFIMTVKLYLNSYAKQKNDAAWSLKAFVSLTHHELLHHLLDNTENMEFRKFSALSQKYRNEAHNVLAHTHLMAIQKAVYEELRRDDLLQETNKIYAHIGGDYARAWDLVKAEGAAGFLDELKRWNLIH